MLPPDYNAPSVTGHFIEMWLARYPKSTRRAYRRDIVDFADFSKISVAEMHSLNVNLIFMQAQNWLNGLTGSSATVARKASSLRSYFEFLTRLRIIATNPLEHLRVPKVKFRAQDILTREDVGRILAAITRQDLTGERDRCIVLMLAELGLRRHELTALCIKSIQKDADGRTILTVIEKRDKPRAVPLSKSLKESVNGYLSRFTVLLPDDPLFRNRDGGRLSDNSVYNIVQHYADLAGIGKVISPRLFSRFVETEMTQNQIETVRNIQERRGYRF